MPDAIILAGGGIEPGLDPGLPNKAFITIAGRPLVEYVGAALHAASGVARIAAVGPVDALRPVLPPDALLLPPAGEIMDNVEQATAALQAQDPLLVAAADLPLLTADAVDEFLAACERGTADFYYPVVPREVLEQRFPTARKTYVTLADGTFCGGSVIVFNPKVIDRVRPFVERVIEARKKPWLLAQMFGWSIVMKFAANRLTIEEIVAKATEVVGIPVQPVVIARPELALDVDVGRPENLEAARRVLEGEVTGDS
ncbi:MAG TPA: nucleotidyltransferase family protein [bacterium]|nr:nucleotidyltransferase family protein [bacterium]